MQSQLEIIVTVITHTPQMKYAYLSSKTLLINVLWNTRISPEVAMGSLSSEHLQTHLLPDGACIFLVPLSKASMGKKAYFCLSGR